MGIVSAADAPKAAAKADDLFPDKVVARGQGVEVKQSEVEAEFLSYKMEIAITGGEVPETRRAEFEKKIIDRLLMTRLLLLQATDADKAKAKESVDRFVTRAKEQAGSEEKYRRQVEARGHSQEDFETKLMERAVAEEVFNREVKAKINVSDAEIKKFYDDNPDRFKQPELVHVAHILKLTFDPKLKQIAGAGDKADLSEDEKKIKRQQIEAVLKRARDGEDFTKLAKENSEDPAVKQNGGEYTFGRGQMAVEFETAAFALGINQISDVVTTKSGYHIIKMIEKTPPQKLEFEKVKDKIKEFLIQQESDKQVPAFTEKVKKEAGVEILK